MKIMVKKQIGKKEFEINWLCGILWFYTHIASVCGCLLVSTKQWASGWEVYILFPFLTCYIVNEFYLLLFIFFILNIDNCYDDIKICLCLQDLFDFFGPCCIINSVLSAREEGKRWAENKMISNHPSLKEFMI